MIKMTNSYYLIMTVSWDTTILKSRRKTTRYADNNQPNILRKNDWNDGFILEF